MTKTLEQQLDFQPGENQTLEFLIENYGNQLEALTRGDKLFIISTLAMHLKSQESNYHPDLLKIIYLCSNLSRIDIEYLISAISHQVKTGSYAETH
jgi:hypothetical protein